MKKLLLLLPLVLVTFAIILQISFVILDLTGNTQTINKIEEKVQSILNS